MFYIRHRLSSDCNRRHQILICLADISFQRLHCFVKTFGKIIPVLGWIALAISFWVHQLFGFWCSCSVYVDFKVSSSFTVFVQDKSELALMQSVDFLLDADCIWFIISSTTVLDCNCIFGIITSKLFSFDRSWTHPVFKLKLQTLNYIHNFSR